MTTTDVSDITDIPEISFTEADIIHFHEDVPHDADDHTFKVADYVVFAGMLAISAIIGIYYAYTGRKKEENTQDFLMGSRSMGIFPVAISLLASFLSAITLLGLPAEIYQYGTQYWTQIITYPLIMFLTSYFFIPVFYNLGLTSSYEYLEKRFDRSVRTLGSALFCLQMLFYMAIVLYAPSLALAQVTGLNVWFSVLSIGIVCTFYTSIGGLKAVIWTDVFQTLVMFGSMLAVVIKGIVDAGGLGEVFQSNGRSGRLEFFNMDPNPLVRHTFWTVCIGSIINWTSVYSTNQAMVQRYLSTPTLKQAKSTVWVVLPFLIVMITLCCLAGMVIYAKYEACDVVSGKRVSALDQLFPLFVMETLDIPGFPGLFVAGIFSGALSTVSSGVNSLAAVTLEDFIKNYISPNISEKKAAKYTKLIALFYGFLSIALVVVAQNMGNVLQAALAIFGLIGAPIFALFITGMFIPSVNARGAFWGTILGLASSLCVGIGAMMFYKPVHPKKPMRLDGCSYSYSEIILQSTVAPPSIQEINADIPFIFRISYQYYGVVGAGVTIIAAYLISTFLFCKLDSDKPLDPNLLTPLVRKYYNKKGINTPIFSNWLKPKGLYTVNHVEYGVSNGGMLNGGYVPENDTNNNNNKR